MQAGSRSADAGKGSKAVRRPDLSASRGLKAVRHDKPAQSPLPAPASRWWREASLALSRDVGAPVLHTLREQAQTSYSDFRLAQRAALLRMVKSIEVGNGLLRASLSGESNNAGVLKSSKSDAEHVSVASVPFAALVVTPFHGVAEHFELTLHLNDVVLVTTCALGWWHGELNSRFGWFPDSCVVPCADPNPLPAPAAPASEKHVPPSGESMLQTNTAEVALSLSHAPWIAGATVPSHEPDEQAGMELRWQDSLDYVSGQAVSRTDASQSPLEMHGDNEPAWRVGLALHAAASGAASATLVAGHAADTRVVGHDAGERIVDDGIVPISPRSPVQVELTVHIGEVFVQPLAHEPPPRPVPVTHPMAMASVQRDNSGRRLKLLALSGAELMALACARFFAVGIVARAHRLIQFSRRVTKMFAITVCFRSLRRRQQAARRCAMFSLGLCLQAQKVHVASKCAVMKLFCAGICLKAAREHVQLRRVQDRDRLAAAPSLNTKRLRWEGIDDAAVSGTIWDRLGSPVLPSHPELRRDVSVVDAGELVASLLGTFSERASASSRLASDSVKPAVVAAVSSLLPSNVAQNASITVRGALGKRPIESVIACVAGMDVDALGGMDVVSALMKLSAVYEDKASVLSAFAGPLDKLSAGEQFLILVARELPTFFARLKVLELQYTLPELASSFFNRCGLFSSICAEIRESKRLQTLLADVILPLGQKLNQGNKRLAVCAGMRLSSLPELARVRGESGETFLQFVISSLLDKAPSVLEFGQDFPKLLSTKLDTLAFSVFQEELAALNAGLRDVTALHAVHRSDPQFMSYISDKMALLQQVTSQCRASFNAANEAYAATARYLGESASSCPPEALFKQLASFLSDIIRSVASLREKAHRLRLRSVKSRTVAASPRGSRRRSSLLVAVVAEAQAKNRRSIRLSPIDTDAVALEEPPTSARRRLSSLSLRRVSVAKVSTPTSTRPTSLRRAADALPILPE